MNQFRVIDGQGDAFEEAWRSRETWSSWESRQVFVDWTESEAFPKAHAQGRVKGLLQGPPGFAGYEVVI